MVAKISVGDSLYGSLVYNGEKINKEKGKVLATNMVVSSFLVEVGSGKSWPVWARLAARQQHNRGDGLLQLRRV